MQSLFRSFFTVSFYTILILILTFKFLLIAISNLFSKYYHYNITNTINTYLNTNNIDSLSNEAIVDHPQPACELAWRKPVLCGVPRQSHQDMESDPSPQHTPPLVIGKGLGIIQSNRFLIASVL